MSRPLRLARRRQGPRETEEIAASGREIFVHYPDGQADTKLRMPRCESGPARNMNTVAKLARMPN